MEKENSKALRKKISEQDRRISSLLVKINHQTLIFEEVKKELELLKAETSDNFIEKINFLIQRIKQLTSENNKSWDEFMMHFEKVNPGFYDQLLEINPKLSANDLKHCAYIRMQLAKKEIARLFAINHRSVEMAHYRIKRKLDIDTNISLTTFIQTLGEQRPL